MFTNDTSKARPVYGDHIWMHLRKYGYNRKEMFNTRIFDVAEGVEMEYKKSERKADVTEVFAFMGAGDSAQVRIPARLLDSLAPPKKYFTYNIYLINFKSNEQYLLEKYRHEQQQRVLDSLSIIDYIRKNDLHDCSRDQYGIWYMRKQKGNGAEITENDSVSIHYIGKLTNDKEFDNSYDRKQPFSFVVGKKQVIEGLDKGIRQFHYGDSGVIILPSRYGYGDKEVGKIPANSVLVFLIEIMK